MRASTAAITRAPEPSQTDAARMERQRHQVRLITRFKNASLAEVSWRCPACSGRVDITGTFYEDGTQRGSTGECRTAGCIRWTE